MRKMMMGNKWGLLSLAVIFVLMFAIAGCSGGNAPPAASPGAQEPAPPSGEATSPPGNEAPQTPKPEKENVKVGLPLDTATFLPIYVAADQGMFKDEGLNVEVFAFQGDAGVVQALAGDSVDISVASLTGLVKSINAGQPFIAFWGGFNQFDFAWYSPKIKTMEETKGATFGITTYGSLTDFLTKYALREGGVDPEKDVQILQAGGSSARVAAMESGQLDASILATPFKFMAEDKGWNLLMGREDVSESWPNHVVYAKKSLIDNNPETAKAFLRAMVRAVKYIETDVEGATKITMDKLQFEEKYARLAVEDVTPGFDKKGGVTPEGLEVFWDISVEAGDTDSAWPEEKWLDRRFIDTQDEWLK